MTFALLQRWPVNEGRRFGMIPSYHLLHHGLHCLHVLVCFGSGIATPRICHCMAMKSRDCFIVIANQRCYLRFPVCMASNSTLFKYFCFVAGDCLS